VVLLVLPVLSPILPRRLANLVHKLFITLTLLVSPSIALAQSITLSIGSGSATAGGTVAVPIDLTSTGGAQTAGFQWAFNVSSDIIGVTVVAGSSTSNAGKSLSCSGNNCLIVGFNSTVIADGTVAIATFQIAPNPSSSAIRIQLTNVVASSASGVSIPSSGGAGSISLPSVSLPSVSLSSLNCSSQNINSPGTSNCAVILTAATPSAVNVALLSNNTSVTVPASVNIGAGLSSATFTAAAAAVVSNQSAVLTATLNGVSQTLTLNATAPSSAQLTSVVCAPSTIGSNGSSTCTVTLNKAATNAATISLASNSGLLAVPGGVSVAPGQSSATFAATSGAVSGSQSVTVTATLNGVSQQAMISLSGAAQLSSLSCTPGTVSSPGTASCTVTLTASASSAVNVMLLSKNTSVTVPASVSIDAGLSSATFTAAAAAVVSNQSAVLTATLDGVSQTFTLTTTAPSSTQLTSLACTLSTLGSNASSTCTVSLNNPASSAATVSLASNNGLLTVPASIVVPSGQSSAAFSANSGAVSTSQSVTVTAGWNGQSQQATIRLAPPSNCEEFQTSPDGLCMIQDLLPWVTFGGGWESRLTAGNIPNGIGGGAIQFSFTLLPAAPATGGVQNHMPAWFKDSQSGQMQLAENASYTLDAGESVVVNFLAPPAGCDAHGQNCGNSQDSNTMAYGSVLIQYVAENPAYLRGIAKAQLSLLANAASGAYCWQTTEREMPAANLWTAPVAVSANQTANPQSSQQASAALANPGAAPITVRGTLYDGNGRTVTSRDFQVPPLGSVAMVFSQDPGQTFGGFGNAMFPAGQDFNGLVSFQVISPNGGSVATMVLQYVGNAMSSVELNSQNPSPASVTSATRCAEFPMAADGTCTVQYTLPWAVFGAGWESRLKAANPPSTSAGAVQLRFTLLPAASATGGSQNHLPAYFTDSRNGAMQMGESANYTLNAGQSVDVNFLYPPAGCDINGQNCGSQPDPNRLSFGSLMVQYSSTDPTVLRRLAYPQLAFLTRPDGESYSSQITEHGAPAATTWRAPVAMSANQGADPLRNLAASAAIANPGTVPVTVRGTLLDQNGNVVAHNDFQIPASGATGIVFAWDPSRPFGGFGSAPFQQGQDFHGWVTFDVVTPGTSGVSVVVLQYVGSTVSGVDAQSFP
jgi:hypothetical protein